MILIVEDNPHLRALWLAVLARAGYAVRGAESGAHAIAVCIETPPDAVVMDLDLPDMSGFALIEEIRPLGTFPIAALSGAEDLGDLSRLGFAEAHTKPITQADMLALVDRLLAERTATMKPIRLLILVAAFSLGLACGGVEEDAVETTAPSSAALTAVGATTNGLPGGGHNCCWRAGTWYTVAACGASVILTPVNLQAHCSCAPVGLWC